MPPISKTIQGLIHILEEGGVATAGCPIIKPKLTIFPGTESDMIGLAFKKGKREVSLETADASINEMHGIIEELSKPKNDELRKIAEQLVIKDNLAPRAKGFKWPKQKLNKHNPFFNQNIIGVYQKSREYYSERLYREWHYIEGLINEAITEIQKSLPEKAKLLRWSDGFEDSAKASSVLEWYKECPGIDPLKPKHLKLKVLQWQSNWCYFALGAWEMQRLIKDICEVSTAEDKEKALQEKIKKRSKGEEAEIIINQPRKSFFDFIRKKSQPEELQTEKEFIKEFDEKEELKGALNFMFREDKKAESVIHNKEARKILIADAPYLDLNNDQVALLKSIDKKLK